MEKVHNSWGKNLPLDQQNTSEANAFHFTLHGRMSMMKCVAVTHLYKKVQIDIWQDRTLMENEWLKKKKMEKKKTKDDANFIRRIYTFQQSWQTVTACNVFHISWTANCWLAHLTGVSLTAGPFVMLTKQKASEK